MAFDRHLDPVIAEYRSHGNAAGQGLGQAKHVGLHELLAGKQRAGAAKAGLDLVDDQQDAPGIANFAHFLKIFPIADFDPPFALDDFQQDRRGAVAGRCIQLGHVVVGDML